jgi:hypothetical protein
MRGMRRSDWLGPLCAQVVKRWEDRKIKFLKEEQALVLQTIDGFRDARTVSLRQLAQRALRLRDDLANDVAGRLNLGD